MANISMTMPTDYSAEAADIERRRKLAEALQAQAFQPLQSSGTAGGAPIPISPYAGLAQMLNAYTGGMGQRRATEESKALAGRYRTEGADALAKGLQAYRGTPGSPGITPLTPNDDEGNAMPSTAAVPAVAGDPNAAMAAWGGHPMTQPYAAAVLAQALKTQDPYTLAPGAKRIGPNGQVMADNPKPPEGFSLTPGGARFGPDGTQIAALPEKAPKDEGAWSEPYDLGGAYVQKNSLTGQVRQAVAREPVTNVSVPPPITAVTLQDPKDPSATIIIDGRTREVLGKGPKLTDAGKLEQKRQFNMQGIGATIKEAEDLLSGSATGTAPTGSGVGAAVDYAGRLIGKSPKGAKEAATLEAVSGALVSKMPRMEGPQSDKDVVLYKEMAGKVGDRTVPIGERQMALNKVKDLWAKYERLNPDAFADRRATSDAAQSPNAAYVETRRTKDGRMMGKKADGTIEEIKP